MRDSELTGATIFELSNADLGTLIDAALEFVDVSEASRQILDAAWDELLRRYPAPTHVGINDTADVPQPSAC
jgi:hypothetical protein